MQLSLADVDTRRHAALVATTEAAGGAGLCTLARTGQSVPAAKYHEGAAAALGQLRRAIKSGASPTGAIELLVSEWEAVPHQTPDWSAYRLGGLDVLHDLQTSHDL